MLIYLDTVIVIYTIEGVPAFQARAVERLAAANAAGDSLATSDLTRLECLVQPLRSNNPVLQADYSQFLGKTKVLPLPPAVYDRAARIRANHNYRVSDSLHLAAAVVGNCDLFLTNDGRLAGFPDIRVEILP
jgi:predicted nucleic acid-binding protein